MDKRTIKLLEKVFEAEISGLLPYQTKAKLAQEMCDSGLLEFNEIKKGALTVSGYSLTHRGRIEYCEQCGDIDDPFSPKS
ncbi:hypothetical protein [Pseudomonas sp.]|uniref:hypothetical protein n=1 Tax=Pseudomonas sp. TaxID=306 RepID=UPI002898C770|nr:hypothetical protein [Pseudomonas sp.]